jgi:transcriptional regulator with GAF, ATPase, and Fis domain
MPGQANSNSIPEKIKALSRERWGQKIDLVGCTPSFLEALQKLEQFAQSGQPLLISGESGVGKELFARSLHLLSNQNGRPFIPINCSQFNNEHLLVSELFGHTKGSFTGAVGEHRGVFETADHGYIFLDEVGELSPATQKMLLRVIDQKEIRPVGSLKSKYIDIRVISATNSDLENLIETRQFREDLFYRLSCLQLHIPPLRQRREDIVLLLYYYLNKLNERYGIEKQFSGEVIENLKQYSFPGNVRELINIVETGFRVCRKRTIKFEDIKNKLRKRKPNSHLSPGISAYYQRMADKGESFWEVVRPAFLNRDLNRSEVQSIIQEGFKEAGCYKRLLKIFNIPERDYKKFLNFLQTHQLKL